MFRVLAVGPNVDRCISEQLMSPAPISSQKVLHLKQSCGLVLTHTCVWYRLLCPTSFQ